MLKELSIATVVLISCRAAPAIINPNFTPKHLVEQADLVQAGTIQPGADAGEWKMAGATALKGKGGDCALGLAKCNKDQVDDIKKAFAASGKAPALLFAGTLNERKCAYLHLGGMWLGLGEGDKNRWDVQGFDAQMSGTYVGGTEMLVRMTRHLLADPDADVPISAGVRWMDNCKVGQVKGEIGGMTVIDIGQPPKIHLFVASSAGDRLFRPKKDKDADAFEDVTRATKLDSKSRRFAWVDVNGDGLMDLASCDGRSVSLRLGGKDGTFKDAGGAWTFKTEGECLGLAACSTGGVPAVLVSVDGVPLLLTAGAGGWKKADLPTGAAVQDDLGRPSACVVADFNNDGFADALQPKEKGGLLWKGGAGGFEGPVACPVCTGGGAGVAAIGDFDGDGFLDVFLSGSERNTIWENDGRGGFQEVFRNAGSVSYKCPPNASDVKVMDLNHDGRSDLCLVYPEADLLYHWNRGYRSFGEEGEVRLTAQAPELGKPPAGQKTMAAADFNGDHSLDLTVASTAGDVYCYFNDKTDRPGVNLRLKAGATGPATASCWTGDQKNPVCLGAAAVTGFSPPAYLSARFSGNVLVKFHLPGKPDQSRKLTVEDKTVEVILGEEPTTTSGKSK